MAERKSYDERFMERIAERQAALGKPKEGKVFEHGPARFLFLFIIGFVVLLHVVLLAIMAASGMH